MVVFLLLKQFKERQKTMDRLDKLDKLKSEYNKFMQFLISWTNKEEGTWEYQAMSKQAVPMLKLLIDIVMFHNHKLDDIVTQKIIVLISEATGLPAGQISNQIYNSEVLLPKLKAD
jgi:hypothetical protein